MEKLKNKIEEARNKRKNIDREIRDEFGCAKEKFKVIRTKLKKVLFAIDTIGLSFEEYKYERVFPEYSYSRLNSYDLIEACKMGELERVVEILD